MASKDVVTADTPRVVTASAPGLWPGLAEFEDRAMILGELHARPFEPLDVPRRIYHFAFLTNDEQARADRAALSALSEAQGQNPPGPNTKVHRLNLPDYRLKWEQHSEFTTYTWYRPLTGSLFDTAEAQGLAASIGLRQPGPLIVAVRMSVLVPGPDPIAYDQIFQPASLCVVNAEHGAARIATDLQVDTQGFTRYVIEDHGLTAQQAGTMTQRVLEIETYRTLALLGLTATRRAGPVVRRIEQSLADTTRAVATAKGMADNRRLLEQLSGMAAELEATSAETSYRFGASRAYWDIVNQRLKAIHEAEHQGYRTLTAFFARRLLPAIATGNTIDARQDLLSDKLTRTANLLRTRIQFELEEQNRDLLKSMNHRARMQLRLQQTVEGLSIAAVSYYVVGLAGYLFKGLADAGATLGISAGTLTAAVVPLVVAGVWYLLRQARRHFTKPDD